tara:strand:+ start:1473 stop:1682 length:210 start_codon:yes stop_codon:yes gene_type:complete
MQVWNEDEYQAWLDHISAFSLLILGEPATDGPIPRKFFAAGMPAGLVAQMYVCAQLDAATNEPAETEEQ